MKKTTEEKIIEFLEKDTEMKYVRKFLAYLMVGFIIYFIVCLFTDIGSSHPAYIWTLKDAWGGVGIFIVLPVTGACIYDAFKK